MAYPQSQHDSVDSTCSGSVTSDSSSVVQYM